MSRKFLMLLRHAKSSWNEPLADHERPLSRRGLRDAPRMALWCSEHGPAPDRVICSTARRCRETIAPFVQLMPGLSGAVLYERELYHASGSTLLDLATTALESHHSVLLAGHNPGLDDLLLDLAGDSVRYSDSGKLMTTAAMAVLAMDTPGNFQLLELVRPRELP